MELDARCSCSIGEWILLYVQRHREETLHDHSDNSIAHVVLSLLRLAFPVLLNDVHQSNKLLDGWDIVIAVLEAFYEGPLHVAKDDFPFTTIDENVLQNKSFTRLLGFLLGAVVQSEERATFVRDIMTMDDAVQADLMQVIEQVMAYNPHGVDQTQKQDDKEITEEKSVADAPSEADVSVNPDDVPSEALADPQSPLYSTRNAELERSRRENSILKDENMHLAKELEDATKKYDTAQHQVVHLTGTIEQLKLQFEVDLLKKERSVRSLYDDRVQSLESQLDIVTEQLRVNGNAEIEVAKLRDEVDLLRPAAEKTAKLESTLAKYKAKIEDLRSVKEQLRRMEETNAELVEKQLVLETQLTKASSLQRKLTEARDANAAAAFRISELETRLSRKESELTRVIGEYEACQAALAEASSLKSQLEETIAQQGYCEKRGSMIESSNTSADGISELNPELMQKLARLEHENEQLKLQIDGQKSEHLESLMDRIDDLERVKKSFEVKYFETEENLKQTIDELQMRTAELQTSQQRNSELEIANEKMSARIQELEATVQMQFDGINALHERIREQTAQLGMMHEDTEMQLCIAREKAVMMSARHYEELDQLERDRVAAQQQHALEIKQMQHIQEMQAIAALESVESKNMQIEELCGMLLVVEQKLLQKQQDLVNEYERKLNDVMGTKTSLEQEFQEYVITHSKSDAEMKAKEEDLKQRIASMGEEMNDTQASHTTETNRLNEMIASSNESMEKMKTTFAMQEQKFKDTIKTQVNANIQLNEANQTLKADVMKKKQTILRLEHSVTTLESKILLLEKERAHYSSQEEKIRGSHEESASLSSQMTSQVSRMIAEFEKLHEEHKQLTQQQELCTCGQESNGSSNTTDRKNQYYMDRIHQMQAQQRQDEEKRRELLLVNAKLIQEQKQIQQQNTTLRNDLQQMKEKMNSWLLREERRKKDEAALRSRIQGLENDLEIARQQSTASNDDAEKENVPSVVATDEKCDHKATHSDGTKRKRDEIEREHLTPPTQETNSRIPRSNEDSFCDQLHASSQASNTSITTTARPKKRRLSHFISSRLQSSNASSATPSNTAIKEDEKPSECQQQ